MPNTEKYAWVNALRGYAILLVILIHSSFYFDVSEIGRSIYNNGDLGVQLFFILSSFTLFNSYAKRQRDERDSLNKNFFIRRLFRIAPYYYIASFIYVLYNVARHHEINLKNLIANYTFTNGVYLPGINDIPPGGWSIGVEMLFYLLIPVLFKYINNLRRAVILLVLSIAFSILVNHILIDSTTAVLTWIFGEYNQSALYFWLPNQLPIFILGIILFHINRSTKFSTASGQAMLAVSIILFIACSYVKFSPDFPFYLIKREYVYGLIFTLFAIGAYTSQNHLVINKAAQKIGIVSFSMYLNHFLLLYISGFAVKTISSKLIQHFQLPEKLFQNDLIFLLFYLSLVTATYFVSRVTYKHVEERGIKYGEKLIARRSAAQPAGAQR